MRRPDGLKRYQYAGRLTGLLGLALLAAGTAPAQATMIVTALETGGDVVFSGSGTLDLADWDFSATVEAIGITVDPDQSLTLGAVPAFLSIYGENGVSTDFTGPTSIGPGVALMTADSSAGDYFGLVFLPSSPLLFVPQGYSGGALSGSATYAGETFASLGLAPGTYVWTWGSGSSADTFVLNIPEPSAVLFIATGLAALAWRMRRELSA